MAVAFDETVRRQVESEIRNIKAEYRDLIPEESIDIAANESLRRLANSRVPQFVPLFVGRYTRQSIKEILDRSRSSGS